jgi:hypothetical protein
MTGISLIESTAYIIDFLSLLLIFPTPKAFWISSNKDRSFKCKVIEKTGLTLHLVFNLTLGCIFIEKQPSASENPVINHGVISVFKFKIENDLLFNCLERILNG